MNVSSLFDRAVDLHRAQDHALAETTYRRVLVLAPDLAGALHNYALLARARAPKHDQAAIARALALIRRAVTVRPDEQGYHFAAANGLLDLGRTEAARIAHRRAIILDPGHSRALGNLGQVEIEAGRHDAAERSLIRALCADPQSGVAKSFLGEIQLSRGLFPTGWRMYLARSPVIDEPFDTADTVEIVADGGLGDALMLARFLVPTRIATLGAADYRMSGPEPLRELMIAGLPHLRWHTEDSGSSMNRRVSLSRILPRLGSQPVDTEIRSDWLRGTFSKPCRSPTGRRRIGLCWRSGSGGYRKRKRDLPPATLGPLEAVDGCSFVSLQTGESAIPPLPLLDRTTGYMGASGMVRMANEIAALDLVVTVDTYVAHLAGAIGVPVWVLLPVGPCWRWGMPGKASPWYPNARLFRQGRAGCWDDVVEALVDALREG